MEEDSERPWYISIGPPFFPFGITVSRMVSTDELRDIMEEIRSKLPEWHAESYHMKRVMADLGKIGEVP